MIWIVTMLIAPPLSSKAVACAPKAFPNSRMIVPRSDGSEDRQGDVAPVLEGARAHVLGRLPPVLAQPVDGRRDDQDHERELEVHVGELEAVLE